MDSGSMAPQILILGTRKWSGSQPGRFIPGKVVLVPIEWEAGWAPRPVWTLCTRDYILLLTRTLVLFDPCGVCNGCNLFAYDVCKIRNTVSCPLQPATDHAFLSTYSESPDFKNALFLVA